VILGAASLAYAAAMQNNDAYKNASAYQRYYYWFIPMAGLDEPLRIRIPFEAGVMFKAIPEMLFQLATGAEDAKEATKGLGSAAWNSWPFNLPPAFNAFIEQTTGISTFSGKPLESAALQKLDPQLRYNAYTTETAKQVGAMLGMSPIKIEALVNNFTSGTGIALLSMMDPMIHAMQAEPVAGPVAGTASSTPIFGRLFQPSDASGPISEAYAAITDFQQRAATLKNLMDKGHGEEAQRYATQYAREIMLGGKPSKALSTQMSKWRKIENAIREAPESRLSPERKQELLKNLRRAELQYASSFRAATASKALAF
jgi:hypothetical protein